MKILVPASIALIATLPACAKKPAADDAAAPTASAKPTDGPAPKQSAPTASADAPEAPPKELSGCEKVLADFDQVLSAATFQCKKDTDCSCFPGQLSKIPDHDCGGVVEKASGKKLDALYAAAKKDGCGTMAQCEPWSCEPICEDGRCQRGPRDKKKK